MEIYPGNFEQKIGFDRIREQITALCVFELGETWVTDMRFQTAPEQISCAQQCVAEFLAVLESDRSFPVDHYKNMVPCLKKIRLEGTFIEVSELFDLKVSLEAIRLVIHYFDEEEGRLYPGLKALTKDAGVYPYVMEQINRIMTGKGRIRDGASPELARIRAALKNRIAGVSKRMNTIFKKAREEGIIEEGTELSMRNGRMVIPVRASDKRRISGLVHDESSTGKTCYIEPGEIVEMNNEIKELEYSEKRELIRILTDFTNNIRPYLEAMMASYSFLGQIDFIRAKALYAGKFNAVVPQFAEVPCIDWEHAVHPLLYMNFKKAGKEVVPLDIKLDDRQRILLISGPNAGGKSVCLQTVGLVQYMFQCGIPVPAGTHSKFGIFDRLFLDFGDEQSLDNDLSTYSSHLLNMKYFLKHADGKTLILIDEFGTGTEPMLGGALAQAILGRLDDSGVYGVITTHYTILKHFASGREGIVNGAMLFDHQNMQPLYKLQTGKPGSSFAFEIARSIGLPEDILKTATSEVGADHIYFDKHLREIARDKRYWENKRSRIRKAEKKLEEILEKYTGELQAFEKEKKKIREKARLEADEMLSAVNRTIEKTIKEIRESQAEKERTKKARKELADRVSGMDVEAGREDQKIENKLNQLAAQKQMRKVRDKMAGEGAAERVSKAPGLAAGDAVRMRGQDAAGEVLEVSGSRCVVAFGNMITSLPSDKLERISTEEYQISASGSGRPDSIAVRLQERRMSFKPYLDIRGKRVEEALQEVRDFVDDAIMVSSFNLSILHGKGDGILRSAVREFLNSMEVVNSCKDEHPDRGGAGITLVQLDF